MELNVTAYHRLDDPHLMTAWNTAMQASRTDSIFRTHEWCQVWAATVGRDSEPFVLVARNGDAVVGLWPLCIARSGAIRWIKFLGSDRVRGDHLDLLCDPGIHDEVAHAFLRHLQGCGTVSDGLLLDGITLDSKTHVLLRNWAKTNGFRSVDREIQTLPFIDLPSTFDEYLTTLSHKRRSAVRRSRRKLSGEGAKVTMSRGCDDLQHLLSEFFRLHALRWNAVGVESNFTDSQMRDFLCGFCARAANQDWLRAYSLVVRGKTEGVLLAFHFQDRACFYQIGRDPNSPVLNAGMILMTASIEQAINESMVRYDFLRGDEPYKSRLAKSQSKQATVMVGLRRPATMVIAKEQLSQSMKRIANRLLGDKRWSQLKKRLRSRQGASKSAFAPGAEAES